VTVGIHNTQSVKGNGLPRRQKKLVPFRFRLWRKLHYTPSFFLYPNEPASLGFVGDPIQPSQ